MLNDCPLDRLILSEEEQSALQIVRTILEDTVSSYRITYRDALPNIVILLDDNPRTPICTINTSNYRHKSIGLFTRDRGVRTEIDHQIQSMDEIPKFADALIQTVNAYMK